MTPTLVTALNDQVKYEFEAAFNYLAMVVYFEEQTFPGMAHWMRLQYQEELVHANKIFDFLLDRGESVALQALDQPSHGFESPLDVFQKALSHEQKVTALIHNLYALSVEEKDYPAQVMLQWFVLEQVEEEKNAGDVIEQLKRIGDDGPALLQLDQQLAQRQPEA